MQIVSENIKIKNIKEFSTEYIEGELKNLGFDFIRWAIVDVQEDFFIVCVSYVIIK